MRTVKTTCRGQQIPEMVRSGKLLTSLEAGEQFPAADHFRYLLTAARRLDCSHSHLSTVRQCADLLQPIESLFRESSRGFLRDKGVRRCFFFLLNEAEITIFALHRALEMAKDGSRELCLDQAPELPETVGSYSLAVKHLRDSYEHIDARAMGRLSGKRGDSGDEALDVFWSARDLLAQRRWKYQDWCLGIDEEATSLMIALGDHLRALWMAALDANA